MTQYGFWGVDLGFGKRGMVFRIATLTESHAVGVGRVPAIAGYAEINGRGERI